MTLNWSLLSNDERYRKVSEMINRKRTRTQISDSMQVMHSTLDAFCEKHNLVMLEISKTPVVDSDFPDDTSLWTASEAVFRARVHSRAKAGAAEQRRLNAESE